MNGPARLTAWPSPFSARSLSNHLRCTSAKASFGGFSHSILVGRFGGGQILAFDAVTRRIPGELRNQDNNIISIPGLWGLTFGAGNTNSGEANQLFFNADVGG